MKTMKQKIKNIIEESIKTKEELLKGYVDIIAEITSLVIDSLKKGGKLIIFGNGGSAADSQHIVAEFVGRFKKERRALPAIALTTNTSTISAISNDYGYDLSFRRQLEAIAREGDVVIGISTSGNAKNVNEAIGRAKEMNLRTIGFTGRAGGGLAEKADITLKVPSNNTPRIQEMHITAGHIICERVEEALTR